MTATPDQRIELPQQPGQSDAEGIATLRVNPILRHAALSNSVSASMVKFDGRGATALEASVVLKGIADQVAGGDLSYVSSALVAQSVTLDVTVTELMQRAWLNAGEYPDAFHRYMTLALKAQAQNRATLEALARMHQPREQVVRHVHVYEGGQAVVADEFHHHGQGPADAGIDYQPHAARARGVGERPALSSPDPIGNGVPIASGTGQEAVPNARRGRRKRSAAGEPECIQARLKVGGSPSPDAGSAGGVQ